MVRGRLSYLFPSKASDSCEREREGQQSCRFLTDRMSVTWTICCFIFGCLVTCSKGKSVNTTEPDKTDITVVMQCRRSSPTLNEPNPNVTVLRVFVFRAEEILAATEELKHRLFVDIDGRVTLTGVTLEDVGKYRVQVEETEENRTRNIELIIGGNNSPETVDGKLFVMQDPSSSNNSIRLKCGTFSKLGFPLVSAMWRDPAGRTLSSDGLINKDQYFYLDLPTDTADSGDYCCYLDCQAPDFCCLDDQSPLRACAKVHVQTNKKIISLESFTKLQENVSDSTNKLVNLSELDIKNCSSPVDEYMSKVQTLEEEIRKELGSVMNISAEAGMQLEKQTRQMFWNFQLQVDYNLLTAVESCNKLHQHFMKAATGLESKLTNTSDKVEALEQRLDTKLAEIQQASDKADGRLETNMNHSIESLQNYQKQLDYNMSTSLESFKELQKRLMKADMGLELTLTSVLNQVEVLKKKLDKGGEVELQIAEVSGTVNALKQRIDVDLESSGADADRRLETNMNRSLEILQNFQLQLEYNMSRAVNSLNEIMKKLVTSRRDLESNVTTVSNQVEKLGQRLDKDGEMDVKLTRISDRVETQTQRLGTDLAELRVVTANADKILETNTNRSLTSLQSRMQDISKAAERHVLSFNETIKNLQTKSTNEYSSLRQTISTEALKLENRLSQMISEVRSSNQAALTDLRSKTDNRISAIENRLSAIERRFNNHVTSNSQLMETIRSDIATLNKPDRCQKKGYKWHSERCLKVYLLDKSYFDARRVCQTDGAHLYFIKSRGMDEAPLRFAITQVGGLGHRYTVGASDIGHEGKFYWDDGTSLPTSSELWKKYEPNSAGGNEDCVEAFVTDDGLLINDYDCDYWRYFICQYDP